MSESSENLLEIGIYTFAEAARILGVEYRTLRRWATGYSSRGVTHEPLFHAELVDEDVPSLSFLDLAELYFIQEVVNHGVPGVQIRAAARNAASIIGTAHPFSTARFGALGRQVVLLDDDGLVDIESLQNEMLAIVNEHVRFFEFEAGAIRRWHPFGNDRGIVLDPRRRFGAPTIRGRVSVDIVIGLLSAGDSSEFVASLYDLSENDIEDAIAWQTHVEAV